MNRVRKGYCAFTLQPDKHVKESEPWCVVKTDPSDRGKEAALSLGLRHHFTAFEGKGNLVGVCTGGEVSDAGQVSVINEGALQTQGLQKVANLFQAANSLNVSIGK